MIDLETGAVVLDDGRRVGVDCDFSQLATVYSSTPVIYFWYFWQPAEFRTVRREDIR